MEEDNESFRVRIELQIGKKSGDSETSLSLRQYSHRVVAMDKNNITILAVLAVI